MTAREQSRPNAPTLGWPLSARRLAWGPRVLWIVGLALALSVLTAYLWPEAAPIVAVLSFVAVILAALHNQSSPNAVAGDTVVILGCGSLARSLADEWSREENDNPVLGGASVIRAACGAAEATRYIRSSYCDYVVITGHAPPKGQAPTDARGRRPTVVTLERLLGRVLLNAAGDSLALAEERRSHRDDGLYGVAKRSLDVAMALTLGLALIPFFPLLALLIKLDSTGPVLYSQTRVGLGGRPFRIYKFRTMCQDAERHGAVWAETNDPRTTRVGRVLRLTRIDELPQLWNVLIGDMTLVGPRPERPEFTSVLEREFPAYRQRLAVKPGLTGWAQVCFRYTNCIQSSRTKLEYDLYYIKHASLALDLLILARTVLVVVGRRGH